MIPQEGKHNLNPVCSAILVILSAGLTFIPSYYIYSDNPGIVIYFSFLLTVAFILSRHLFLILSISIILLSTALCHIKFHWGFFQLDSRIEVMLESPTYEMVDYLNSYINRNDLYLIVYAFLAVAAAILVYNSRRIDLGRLRKPKLVTFYFLVIIFITTGFHDAIRSSTLYQVPVTIYQAYLQTDITQQRNQFIKTIPPVKLACNPGPDNLIVVFGESALSDRMSIYNPGLDTTPFLETVDALKFNAIAPSNQTRYSLPIYLTGASVSDFSVFFTSRSLISELADCGYETFWVSNQGRAGKHETYISSIAAEADYNIFLNDLSYKTADYDEKIMPELKEIAQQTSSRKSIFIHLMGSHLEYRNRYPTQYNRYKDDSVISQYDNSLYYTDIILARIHDIFHLEDSLFVYISDHGEVVHPDKFGHGYYPGYKEEYRIPFVIWGKSNIRASNARELAGNDRINAESLYSILGYLAGLNDEPTLSRSSMILSLDDNNIVNYEKLEFYRPVLKRSPQ